MLVQQFSRFSIFGVCGFLVDATVLLVVTGMFGLNLYAGRVLSFLAAATTTWVLNRQFTFVTTRSTSRLREWLCFLLFNAFGGLINFGTYAWMIHELAFARAWPLVAVACGSITGLLANFVFSKNFVFRHGRAAQRR
jgi:putative flippase GtrA